MIQGHNLKQKYQRGFTIVELLIVIVIIGILAALVLNSFSGVQAKARDTKRQTDIRAISSQLEAWYNGSGNGSYPSNGAAGTAYASGATAGATSVNLLNNTDVQAKWKGFDVTALTPPNTSGNQVVFLTAAATTGTVSIGQYGYWPQNAAGTTCLTESTCTQYNLYYNAEGNPSAGIQSKSSLNRN
jgi:prepilin-type N-terminal cleavage/methylation domain-containing protein